MTRLRCGHSGTPRMGLLSFSEEEETRVPPSFHMHAKKSSCEDKERASSHGTGSRLTLVITSWRRRWHSPAPCSRSMPACRAPAPGERHGQLPRGHSGCPPAAPGLGFLTRDVSCGRSTRLRGRGALEMLPLMPTSFTVGQTGLGMELPSLTSLGSTRAGWALGSELEPGLAM